MQGTGFFDTFDVFCTSDTTVSVSVVTCSRSAIMSPLSRLKCDLEFMSANESVTHYGNGNLLINFRTLLLLRSLCSGRNNNARDVHCSTSLALHVSIKLNTFHLTSLAFITD
jgi:hypothetical protein